MLSKQVIEEAHERIIPYIHRTPIMTSTSIDDKVGCNIFFKCENFQKGGAFKARGAMNAILSLSEQYRMNGVATHSSGNHAQALARAAKIVGVRSYIVMPRTAPAIKKLGVQSYGGEIFECDPTQQSRETTLAAVIMKTKAAEVHPFNNFEVIAGQATAAKELYEEVDNLNYIVAPVGGGGLLSGTILTTKFFSPKTQIIAAEPEGADDTYRSFKSGKIEKSQSNSIADGLLTSLCDKTFAIIRKGVSQVITVSDEEIIDAMRLLWERLKIIVEPSGAVPLAALMREREKFYGNRVGIILSGGNVDLERALHLMTRKSNV